LSASITYFNERSWGKLTSFGPNLSAMSSRSNGSGSLPFGVAQGFQEPVDPPASRCEALRAGSGLAQTDTHRLTLYFFGTGPARRDTQISRFGDLSSKVTKRGEDVDRLKATRQAGCPDRLIGTHGEQRGSKMSTLIFDPLCSL